VRVWLGCAELGCAELGCAELTHPFRVMCWRGGALRLGGYTGLRGAQKPNAHYRRLSSGGITTGRAYVGTNTY
jgi:hypothetical protein